VKPRGLADASRRVERWSRLNNQPLNRHRLARKALERQRQQASSEYANKVLSDLADVEQKVAGISEDAIRGDQKLEQNCSGRRSTARPSSLWFIPLAGWWPRCSR
jgi:hypothetical protein